MKENVCDDEMIIFGHTGEDTAHFHCSGLTSIDLIKRIFHIQ